MISLRQNEQNFEILEKVGNGGYGTVFKVKNKLDERIYAIKKIKLDTPDFKDDDEETLKVLKECRTLSLLDHPNILRYYGSWLSRPPSPKGDKKSSKSLGSKKYLSFSKGTNRNQLERKNTTLTQGVVSQFGTQMTPVECLSEENSEVSDEDLQDETSPFSRRSFEEFEQDVVGSFMTPDDASSKDKSTILYIQTEYCDINLEQYLEERGRLLNQCQKLPNSNKTMNRHDLELHTLLIYEAFSISLQLIGALKYLHTKEKLIHRDLKPSNVFLNKKSNADS